MTLEFEDIDGLSLEEEYDLPLAEVDLENMNKELYRFLNGVILELSLHPVTYTNLKSNALEFSERIILTKTLEPDVLNRTRELLCLAIPLMKAKDPEVSNLLEKNLKETIGFLKENNTQYDTRGIQLSSTEDHQTLTIDDVKRRLRGLYPERKFVKDITNEMLADFRNKRPIDRTVSESDNWTALLSGLTSGKDSYTQNLDDFVASSLQRMQEQKAEIALARDRAVELSEYKKRAERQAEQAKQDRLRKAVDYLHKVCQERSD